MDMKKVRHIRMKLTCSDTSEEQRIQSKEIIQIEKEREILTTKKVCASKNQ